MNSSLNINIRCVYLKKDFKELKLVASKNILY